MRTTDRRTVKLWFLKRIKLFEGLGPEALKALDELTRMTQVGRHEAIYLPGQPGDYVYLLKAGRVKISRPQPDGRELTLAILEPGEIFGELEALEGEAHDTRAEALEPCAVCIIERDTFARLLEGRADLSIRLTKLIGLRFKRIETRIEDLLYRDVAARLAGLLLGLADEMGCPVAEGVRVHPGLTHRELASLIASTRETVSLTLGEFRSRGLIDFDRKSITIRDRAGLAGLLPRA